MEDSDFGAFFLVYIQKACYISSGFIWYGVSKYQLNKKARFSKGRKIISESSSEIFSSEKSSDTIQSQGVSYNSIKTLLQTPTYSRLIKFSFPLLIWSTGCSHLYTLSLKLTTVGINTVIYQTFVVFVYLFSAIFLNESVTLIKVGSVIICLVGVVLVYLGADDSDDSDDDSSDEDCSDDENTHNSWFGIVLVLASAALYAAYQVLYAKFITMEEEKENLCRLKSLVQHVQATEVQDDRFSDETQKVSENETQSSQNHIYEIENQKIEKVLFSDVVKTLFLVGCFGAVAITTLWLLLVLFEVCGFETLSFPSSTTTWLMLILLVVLSVAYVNILYLALTLVTPLFVSVGCILTIPVSILFDYFFSGISVSHLVILGSLLISIGFVILNVAMSRGSQPELSKPEEDQNNNHSSQETASVNLNSQNLDDDDQEKPLIGFSSEKIEISPSQKKKRDNWIIYVSSAFVYGLMFVCSWLTDLEDNSSDC